MDPVASSVVALGILATIAGITIAAIFRYSIDDALKIWGALSALVGVVTGSFVTYFFTRQVAQQATKRADENALAAQLALNQNAISAQAVQQAEQRAATAKQAANTLARTLDKDTLDQVVASHPAIRSAIDSEPV